MPSPNDFPSSTVEAPSGQPSTVLTDNFAGPMGSVTVDGYYMKSRQVTADSKYPRIFGNAAVWGHKYGLDSRGGQLVSGTAVLIVPLDPSANGGLQAKSASGSGTTIKDLDSLVSRAYNDGTGHSLYYHPRKDQRITCTQQEKVTDDGFAAGLAGLFLQRTRGAIGALMARSRSSISQNQICLS